MTAEVLCVGSELLLGNITNGNARWIAEQLAALGVPHQRQMVVGDNRERLMAEVRQAAGRCRVLITTGGLGPTPDDLTTEAIAAAFVTPWWSTPRSGPRSRRAYLLAAESAPRATAVRPFCLRVLLCSRTPLERPRE